MTDQPQPGEVWIDRRRLHDLQRNPANGNWRMFAHDVAEAAQIAGRVRALRDATVFMEQQ